VSPVRAAAPTRLVLASANPHKVREFERLLGGAVEVDPLPADVTLPPETGETFADNALIKARAAAIATGRPAFADDSGIAAEALDGAPGVRSARYAGEHATDQQNLDKLRADVPPRTGLEYVCVIAYVDGDQELLFEGRCSGRMSAEARGERGFGYDPIFIPDDYDDARTMAELADAGKDAISHRGRAARALQSWLAS
jgi:XTP/dITP diphosphohydrolase